MRASRWILMAALAGLVSGCTSLEPPTRTSAPRPDFRVLEDIGIFDGPPELPPPYHVVDLGDDSFLAVVDQGALQRIRAVRWNGSRWEAFGGTDAALIPPGEPGPYLRTHAISTEDGFAADAVVLVARVPNGPINRVELEVDGTVEDVQIHQRPVFARVFPAGTIFGETFVAFDGGTHELAQGIVHQDR